MSVLAAESYQHLETYLLAQRQNTNDLFPVTNINVESLNELVADTTINYPALQTLTRVLDTFIALDRKIGVENVAEWLQVESTSYGWLFIYRRGEEKSKPLFRGNTSVDYLHATFVGLFGTNSLRENIPNFRYVFGTILYPEPFVCYRKKVRLIPMVVNEVVEGVRWEEWVTNASTSEFEEVIVQIIAALLLAWDQIGFVHGRLDGDAVVIRKHEPVTLAYSQIWVKSGFIPVIGDFVFSTITYEQRKFASHVSDYHNTDPLQDLVLLLVTTLEVGNQDVVAVCRRVFQLFFNTSMMDFSQSTELDNLRGLINLHGLVFLQRFNNSNYSEVAPRVLQKMVGGNISDKSPEEKSIYRCGDAVACPNELKTDESGSVIQIYLLISSGKETPKFSDVELTNFMEMHVKTLNLLIEESNHRNSQITPFLLPVDLNLLTRESTLLYWYQHPPPKRPS